MNTSAVGILNQFYKAAAADSGYKGTPVNTTGIIKTLNYVLKVDPSYFTTEQLKALPAELPGFVGGYPHNTGLDHGITGLMIALMLIMFLGHGYVFMQNYKHGHLFYPTLLVMSHCIMATIGWACRLAWGYNFLNFKLGVVAYVFIFITEYQLGAVNLLLADRIFRTKHSGGRHDMRVKLFFAIGGVSFILSIVGEALPMATYLDSSAVSKINGVQLAGCIMGMIFHLCPILHTLLVYTPNSKNTEVRRIAQPYWIQNIGIFSYFHPQVLEFDHTVGPAIASDNVAAVIELVTPPMTEGPKFSFAVLCTIPSALLLWSTALIRTLSTEYIQDGLPAEYITSTNPLTLSPKWFPVESAALWTFYGGVQTLVLVYWLVMRIDLRFYLPKIVHAHGDFELVDPVTSQKV